MENAISATGFLIGAIFCSTFISISMRFSADKVKGRFGMLAVNYFVCSCLGAFYSGGMPNLMQANEIGLTIFLSIINGILLLGGFLLLQISIQKNGIVLSSLFMKLGLLIPFLTSILLFKEVPTVLQMMGFCIASGAIVLFNLQKGSRIRRFSIELIFLLLMCGGSDAMIKVFEVLGEKSLSNHFLCLSFGVSFVLCAMIVIVKKEHLDRNTLFFGTAIGVANFFSSKLLLVALTQLPAVVVFSTFSVATMLLATSCGITFFKERLDKKQWIAFGAIIVALVLLNI